MQKNKTYQTKTCRVITVQQSHSHLVIPIPDHNHQVSTNFGDSFQINKIHVNIHEIDILDQIVEVIKIRTIFQNITLIELFIRNIIEIDHIQIRETNYIQKIDQETLQKTVIEVIELTAKKNFQKRNTELLKQQTR